MASYVYNNMGTNGDFLFWLSRVNLTADDSNINSKMYDCALCHGYGHSIMNIRVLFNYTVITKHLWNYILAKRFSKHNKLHWPQHPLSC